MPHVKTIAVINQKGGVGKTTLVANVGAAIAARGRSVCLIDLDPQSQLTLHLGVESPDDAPTMYDVLTAEAPIDAAALQAREGLWVVPSVMDLAAAEMELVAKVGREQVLRDRLSGAPLGCDYAIIDCPPSLGLLTLNALAAADELIIPMQAHFLALQGLGRLLETVALVQQRINPQLKVTGIVLSMFDKNTRLAGEVLADLKSFFDQARNTSVPWADVRIFDTAIRRNVKLAECPSYGKTIFEYSPFSHGAEDYGRLAEEFIACMDGRAEENDTATPEPPPDQPAPQAPDDSAAGEPAPPPPPDAAALAAPPSDASEDAPSERGETAFSRQGSQQP